MDFGIFAREIVVSTTKLIKTSGRPRSFNIDMAIEKAQLLFHEYGYDAVSVANLTKELGINPPSFYAAFGSKAELYQRVLKRYTLFDGIPLKTLLDEHKSLDDCLSQILKIAAHYYARNPEKCGCLVIEGTRCKDSVARTIANELQQIAIDQIHHFIVQQHADLADQLTDFICVVMNGLSAKARAGYSEERLLNTAQIASFSIQKILENPNSSNI